MSLFFHKSAEFLSRLADFKKPRQFVELLMLF